MRVDGKRHPGINDPAWSHVIDISAADLQPDHRYTVGTDQQSNHFGPVPAAAHSWSAHTASEEPHEPRA